MSAAEMMCFVRFFGFLAGEKIERGKFDAWDLYILLRKIVDIALSPRIVKGHAIKMDLLVEQFLMLYNKKYGDLVFKFHNMTHIVRLLMNNGPLTQYWSMRYESSHRRIKMSTVTSSNTKNLSKTISLRNQLNLAYMKFKNTLHYNDLSMDDCEKIDAYNKRVYFEESSSDQIYKTDRVIMNGIEYWIDMIVVTEIQKDGLVIFGKVNEIFIEDDEVSLLMQPLIPTYFDDHYYGYFVEPKIVNVFKKCNDLPNIHPCVMIENSEGLMIVTKYIL